MRLVRLGTPPRLHLDIGRAAFQNQFVTANERVLLPDDHFAEMASNKKG